MISRREVLRTIPVVAVVGALAASGTASAAEPTVLSEDEIAGLLHMREEEKLARDVYAVLYRQWQAPVFQTISASEVRHMAAIGNLLAFYGIDDPVGDNLEGEFEDQDLQSLYDSLIEQGGASLESAYRVGTTVEEIDILDLEQYLGLTDESPVQRVYQSLLNGSRSHLRAFARSLSALTGEPFVPEYMTQEEVDAVLGQASGSDRGYRGGRG